MTFMNKYWLSGLASIILVGGLSISMAQADDDEDKVSKTVVSKEKKGSSNTGKAKVANLKWVAECGACHLAFPARFLPAESWREMMSGLDKHFGSDASLDAETASEITVYLVDNARRKKTSRDASGKLPLRITENRWFKREHASAAKRVKDNPKVKSMANCTVCHTKAEQGSYRERDIKIPK